VPTAVIELDFDPILRLGGDVAIRWQTVALGAVIALALVLAAIIGRRSQLRSDDLLYIAIGIVPGAIVGGRLGYAALHIDFYATDPGALLDPAKGSLELVGAVVGGLLSGGYIASLLEAPVGRWLEAATMPLLLGLGLGKLTLALGGAGQGSLSDLPWATAYTGPGPWASIAPDLPAHPAQVYEGLATLVVGLVVAGMVGAGGPFRRRDGRVLAIALLLWAIVRGAVATTWRDAPMIGPIRTEQLLAIALAIGCGAVLLAGRVRPRPLEDPAGDALAPKWPDPTERPRF
jgi:prolipoprotein diacylglyceryltransferase